MFSFLAFGARASAVKIYSQTPLYCMPQYGTIATDSKAERRLRQVPRLLDPHPLALIATDSKAERRLRLYSFELVLYILHVIATDSKAERRLRPPVSTMMIMMNRRNCNRFKSRKAIETLVLLGAVVQQEQNCNRFKSRKAIETRHWLVLSFVVFGIATDSKAERRLRRLQNKQNHLRVCIIAINSKAERRLRPDGSVCVVNGDPFRLQPI